ncbi:hypothetical protein H7U19_00440 [Hyunsoonleella sp. SJ7]|uniref:Trimeric autotransporter adhesin YadA-like head domain-containing protein n=1 Tax=Hyunsoonleella aquatilis TaxID=2762758 RepID=A0A923H9J8_9FLAO|nr:hypothetical protein [Hyunsoonleella aquatilis]MBC3756851.1 hypothetical protein [Hyunsoonleella aquatilis]
MKIKLLFTLFFVSFSQFIIAQVGINTTTPNSALHISSSNQATPANTDGILIPKIDEFPATNPGVNQNGMLVFVTGSGTPAEGFYYWDNATTSWIPFVKQINDLSDGKSDIDGSNNGSSLFLGIGAGNADDASHNRNIGIGLNALNDVIGNTANQGEQNIAIGFQSLQLNTSGSYNVAIGSSTLDANTSGRNNTAIGHNALTNNVDGLRNTAIGFATLAANTSGRNNSAIGGNALNSNTSGSSNVAIGAFSLGENIFGINNSSIGNQSLRFNIYGDNNTAVGDYAGRSLDDDNASDLNNDRNVFIGASSGNSDINSSNNVYIGFEAGGGNYDPETNTGTAENKSGNVFIGYQSGMQESGSNKLYIDNSNTTAPLIYGDFQTNNIEINGDLKVADQNVFKSGRFTAAQASALTAVNGDFIYVTSTNATFTTIGFWGYEGGAWVKL